MNIAVVTDSSAQLSTDECGRHRIHVLPITVVLDGRAHLEGVELDVDEFYGRLASGVEVSTSQPSPGQFLDLWSQLAEAGADHVISVHLGEALSGTLNAARVAIDDAPVPVTLIDTRMTSYGSGVVAMAVADAVAAGGGVEAAVDVAEALIPTIGTTFILQDLRYVLKGGRMRAAELPSGAEDVPVLAGYGGGYELVGTGRSIDALVDAMTAQMTAGDRPRHVAVAHAAPDTIEFTEALEARLQASPVVASVRRYRMGPSIAVYTGPGTAGGFWWPAA